MRKASLAILLLMALVSAASLASAEVSQEKANSICQPYSSEGETIAISDVSCEGGYWVCDFKYYGNNQNVVVVVGKSSGGVIAADNEILDDILSTKFAYEEGGSALFGTVLSDTQFTIEMKGMNTTLGNYFKVLANLRTEGYLNKSAFDGFKVDIDKMRSKSLVLEGRSTLLRNLSGEFLREPDCVALVDYMDEFNETLSIASNFSSSWNRFIQDYNALAARVDNVAIQAINPNNAMLLQQGVEAVRPGLDAYEKREEDYANKVMGNMKTRFERKETVDYLGNVYNSLKDGNNKRAIDRYNDAVDAFSRGEYTLAKRLAMEAAAMPGTEQNTTGKTGTTTEAGTDYTPYLIAVAILLGAILLLTVLRKGAGTGDDGGKPDVDGVDKEPKKPRKKPKRGARWAWTKEEGSSMERASEDSLDT